MATLFKATDFARCLGLSPQTWPRGKTKFIRPDVRAR